MRKEYARKRKSAAYVQVVFDVEDKNAESIPAGTAAVICGWATSAEVDSAPLRDWGAKKGCKSDYLCHGIPIPDLRLMTTLKIAKERSEEISVTDEVPQKKFHEAILEALRDGVHPMTGQDLSGDHVFQDPAVRGAIAAGLVALRKEHQKRKNLENLPRKAGSPWSDEEDQRLGEAFDEGDNIEMLAVKHGRTAGAIRSRLTKMGKIDKVG